MCIEPFVVSLHQLDDGRSFQRKMFGYVSRYQQTVESVLEPSDFLHFVAPSVAGQGYPVAGKSAQRCQRGFGPTAFGNDQEFDGIECRVVQQADDLLHVRQGGRHHVVDRNQYRPFCVFRQPGQCALPLGYAGPSASERGCRYSSAAPHRELLRLSPSIRLPAV